MEKDVYQNASNLMEVQLRARGENISKRDVTLEDLNGDAIPITLWKEVATKFKEMKGKPVRFVNASVGEYNNEKVLKFSKQTTVDMNPQDQDAIAITTMYHNKDT